MTHTTKALLLAAAALLLTGCATGGMQSNAPIQISIAPAIDVSYAEVIKDVPRHIGVNVRWGGQIIDVDEAEKITRLTVLAYPLNDQGQPQKNLVKNFIGGRFMIETEAFEALKGGRFITVYGTVSDRQVLRNGKLTNAIPVVTAFEAKRWTEHDQRYARQRHRLPYNGLELGLRLGHARIAYDYYNHYGYADLSPFFYPYRYFNSRGYGRRRHR
jgi:outer membrane lipoprotein